MSNARAIIPNLSVEEEFILCCARAEMTPANRGRMKELAAGGLDWKRVGEMARLHRLRPLLFKHLKSEGVAPLVPPETWTLIQTQALKMAARNLSLTHELGKILAQFRAADIEVIPFKGPVLALRNYRNLGLREFYDMDLLLRREDLLKAKKLLTEQGFTSPWKQNDQWEQQHIDAQLGCDFLSADGRVRLELHWSFLQKWLSYDIDLETLWSRAEKWELAGQPVRIIDRHNLLIYLCAHGAKHHWERLFWIIDIAEMIRTEKGIEWDQLVAEARAQGSWRVLALGLLLARDLLEAPIPENVSAEIAREPKAASIARYIGTWLFNEERRLVLGSRPESNFFLRVKERFRDRAAFTTHLLKLAAAPSDKDRAFVKLPPAISFLYPAVRVIRCLIWRG